MDCEKVHSHGASRAFGSSWLDQKAGGGIVLIAAALTSCSTTVDDLPGEEKPEDVVAADQAFNANVVGAIQIDGPANGAPGADLLPSVGTPLNTGAQLDWVKDGDANPDLVPGVDSAPGGTGHWHGHRIVDGIAGADQDIFLTGGKENDTSTWNPGPGSVGSSKYDIVQAYLANNTDNLFFGMERRGNNGTTAFDFEFNQKAPQTGTCPQNPRVPCRTVGDVLFTFEMQGSGGSGSAQPFLFTWNGSSYAAGAATGIVSSINAVTTTAGGPWGHVGQQGDWVLGNLERFQFAEATAPLDLLPGVDVCGGRAFVQVRTRSSSAPNSDLKDTTEVFEFEFGTLSGEASLTGSCDADGTLGFTASGTDSEGVAVPAADLVCAWTFRDADDDVVGTSSSCTGSITGASGTVTGSVVLSVAGNPDCTATVDAGSAVVLEPLTVDLALTGAAQSCVPGPMETDVATYTANPGGGTGTYGLVWSGGDSCADDATTCDVGLDSPFCHTDTISVTVSDPSGACDDVTSEQETYAKVTTITVSDNPAL